MKRLLAFIALAILSFTLSAQTTEKGYFYGKVVETDSILGTVTREIKGGITIRKDSLVLERKLQATKQQILHSFNDSLKAAEKRIQGNISADHTPWYVTMLLILILAGIIVMFFTHNGWMAWPLWFGPRVVVLPTPAPAPAPAPVPVTNYPVIKFRVEEAKGLEIYLGQEQENVPVQVQPQAAAPTHDAAPVAEAPVAAESTQQ